MTTGFKGHWVYKYKLGVKEFKTFNSQYSCTVSQRNTYLSTVDIKFETKIPFFA